MHYMVLDPNWEYKRMKRTYANRRVRRGGSQLGLNECHCRFGQEKEHVVPHVKGWHIADC